MEIRSLQKADLPTVRALLGALIRQHAAAEPAVIRPLEELDPYDNGGLPHETLRLVAIEDSRVIGFIQGGIETAPTHAALCERRYFAIYDLVVDPALRRHGVATRLLESCLAWVREQSISDIELNVFAFNEEAIAFYERNGFRVQRLRMTKTV